MSEITETKESFELGLNAAELRHVDGTPYVVIPEGSELKTLENYLHRPIRKRGVIVMRDTESFNRYVKDESDTTTRIYGNLIDPQFVAVLNDSAGVNPGWRDFLVVYKCPKSVEWQTWHSSSGTKMTQETFAQFIEDNLPDIANPPAADMLEIAHTLEAKKKVNFASGIRLSNGQNELTYEETIQGTAGKGKFVVPEQFTLGIPVLEGGDRYAVDARLRYRIAEGGRLSIWYELVRPHKIIEDAVKDVKQKIEIATGFTIFNGSI